MKSEGKGLEQNEHQVLEALRMRPTPPRGGELKDTQLWLEEHTG